MNATTDSGNFTAGDGSTTKDYHLETWVQPVVVFLYCLSFAVSFGGNVSVFWVVLKVRSKNVTNIFIGSLCMLDILVTLFCVPITVVSNLIIYYWPFWPFLCPVVLFLQVSTIIQRSLTLVSMTFDQHYAVWRPLQPRMKKSTAKMIIVCMWTVSLLVAIPTTINSKIIYLPEEPGSRGLCTETWENTDSQHKYSISLLILQYVLPLFVMTLSYIHIGYIVWVKKIPGEEYRQRDRRNTQSKRKTITMLMTMVITYALCWLPLHVLTLLGDQNPDIFNNKYIHLFWLFSHWIATSNSGVNPVIYFWRSSVYRNGVFHLFPCCRSRLDSINARPYGASLQMNQLSKDKQSQLRS